MKALLRIAAVSSFGFCFAGGLAILSIPGKGDAAWLLAAMGLSLIGLAFFAGAILLAVAEKFGRKGEGR
jgi:hypothetical protein